MNFSYGIIAIVGVLVAISLGFIATSPDDIPEPRMASVDEKLPGCTKQWDPMCGADGKTYGNSCMMGAADVKLDYEGECVMPEPIPEPEVVSEPEAVPEPEPTVEPTSEPEVLPMTAIVSIPLGAAVPGCDDEDECYLPYSVSVAKGATVSWSNDDSAAHTVSSGTPAGLTGVFDSGLFMAGGSFEFTFEDAGMYDYFCLVHPWMTGVVDVS